MKIYRLLNDLFSLSLVKRQVSLSPLGTNIFPDYVYWKCFDHIYFLIKKILLVKGLYFRFHRILFYFIFFFVTSFQMYISFIYVEEGCEISNKKTFKLLVKEKQNHQNSLLSYFLKYKIFTNLRFAEDLLLVWFKIKYQSISFNVSKLNRHANIF